MISQDRLGDTDRANMQLAHLQIICQGLLFRIVQQSNECKDRGFVVMLTSPTQGAGVSRITNALADALNKSGGQCAISLDCRTLDDGRHDFGEPININPTRTVEKFTQSAIPPANGDNWQGIHESLARALDKFRQRYRYILIDCPSLRETQEAVRLSPLADGIILVVEANRTQKEQLLYAERSIEGAKGKILGHVLNKRAYAVPDWLSRRMEAIGI